MKTFFVTLFLIFPLLLAPQGAEARRKRKKLKITPEKRLELFFDRTTGCLDLSKLFPESPTDFIRVKKQIERLHCYELEIDRDELKTAFLGKAEVEQRLEHWQPPFHFEEMNEDVTDEHEEAGTEE